MMGAKSLWRLDSSRKARWSEMTAGSESRPSTASNSLSRSASRSSTDPGYRPPRGPPGEAGAASRRYRRTHEQQPFAVVRQARRLTTLTSVGPVPSVRVARFEDLDTPTLYAILRLRCDVFVVEQSC